MRFLRLLLASGGVLAGGYVLWSTLLAVADVFHELPFMDSWDQVYGYELYRRGELPLGALWLQHNEHRIPLQRLLFLADFVWGQGRGVLPIVASFVLQGAQVAILVAVVRRAGVLRRSELVGTAGLTTAAVFSAGQLENFVWPFQTQFFLVFANGTAAIAALHVALRDGATRCGWLAVSGLSAVGAVGSMASGVLVWPVLVLFALHVRAPRRVLVAIVAAALTTLIVFFVGYRLPHDGAALAERSPLQFAAALAFLFGNVLGPQPRAATPVFGAVAGLGVAAFLLGFGWRRSRDAAVSAGMFACLFLAGALVLIAFGRGSGDPERMVTSRYGTPLLLLGAWTLPLWWVRAQQAGSRVGAVAAVVALLGFCALLVAVQPTAVASFRPMHDRQVRAAAALLNGVRDEVALRASHDVDPGYLLERSRTLAAHRRSVFRHGFQDLLGRDLAGAFAVVPGVLPHAAIERVFAVPGEPDALRIDGWSLDAERGRGTEWIVFTDPAGTIVGIGTGGLLATAPRTARADLAGTNDRLGWTGYVRLPTADGPVPVAAWAVWADGRTVQAIAGSCSAVWIGAPK